MLGYPPSRIGLTPLDLADLDIRLATRRPAGGTETRRPRVRIGAVSRHETRRAIMPMGINPAIQRAVSSESEATFFETSENYPEGLPITFVSDAAGQWAVTTPPNVNSQYRDQAPLHLEAARALQSAVQQRQTLSRLYPRHSNDHSSSSHAALQSHVATLVAGSSSGPLSDGVNENASNGRPTQDASSVTLHQVHNLPSAAAHLHDDSMLSGPPHNASARPLLSSARARRRNARSDLEQVDETDSPLQLRQYAEAHSSQRNGDLRHSTARVLHVETSMPSLANPALDPGAPVFMPRTRFGSAVSSSGDHESVGSRLRSNGQSRSGQASVDWRIRPTSEQNVDPQHRRRPILDSALGPTTPHEQSSEVELVQPEALPAYNIRRGSSIASGENVLPPRISPNIERYPILRPPRDQRPRQSSGPGRFGLFPRRVSSGLPLNSASSQQTLSDNSSQHGTYQARSVSSVHFHGTTDPTALLRVPSSALSTSSRSTPNLLRAPETVPRIRSRVSSLSWSQVSSNPPSAQRVSSIVSAASGISGLVDQGSVCRTASRQSSREALDAVVEFLQQRKSPLDDLSDRLSRLSTAHQRSFGRSWERSVEGRSRLSLLNGDPFRQDSPPHATSQRGIQPALRRELSVSVPLPAQDIARGIRLVPTTSIDDDDPTDVAEQPTSSSLPSSPPAISSTPPAWPHRKPLANISPAKTQAAPEPRPHPNLEASHQATPRVRIYNDAEPPATQPQTPADLARTSNMRTRNPSDSAMQAPYNERRARAMMVSPPAIPQRQGHRNTYHSTIPDQTTTAVRQVETVLSPGLARVESVRRETVRRRANSQRSSEQAENEPEEQMHGLEDDRRVWLGRREEGTLEVTPPREGRFEQYLR